MAELKTIKVSEVLNSLKSGVTRWKKEDLGFGSIEEKFDLTFTEMKELMNHPKIRGVKTKIPTLRIIDDVETEETPEETTEDTLVETRIEVAETPIVVKTPQKVTAEVKPFI